MVAGDRAQSGRWSGSAYPQSARHHRVVDEWFLERHRPRPGDVVVDLGCGSGEFTARLAAMVPDGRVIGVEPDPSMLEAASRHAAPNLEFRQATAERLDEVVAESSADLVVSRAVLHWLPVDSYPHCFDAVFRVLRPGGWFHSESGGAGNTAGVVALVERTGAEYGISPSPPSFLDAGTGFDLVEAAGFDIPVNGVRTVAQRRSFTREELVAFLHNQASVALTSATEGGDAGALRAALTAAADELRRADGSYDQTFVRLEILAQRPA
ncbi:MAG: class I SAM-dependent methyltransferase [Actinomycetota bacterium]